MGENTTDRQYCCGGLKQLVTDWDWTFSYPVMFDRKTGKLHADTLTIHLAKATKSGEPSKTRRAQMTLHFCPVCGAEVKPIEKARCSNTT